jgi:hypothetical protein
MLPGKLAQLSWQIGTPFFDKPQKKLPEDFWQIGTLQDWD